MFGGASPAPQFLQYGREGLSEVFKGSAAVCDPKPPRPFALDIFETPTGPPDPRSPKTPQQQKKEIPKTLKTPIIPKVDARSPKVDARSPKVDAPVPKSRRSFPKSKR